MIVRWALTLALAISMGWVFRVLNAERLQRAAQFVLPDTSLPFDEFRAAMAAQKADIALQSLLTAGVLGGIVAGIAAVFAMIQLWLLKRPVGLTARFHWLWMSHSILPFCAVAIGLVAAVGLG